MFTKIKKVFKYTVYTSAAIVALAVVIDIAHETDSERFDRSMSKSERALEVLVERARVEEENRIAEEEKRIAEAKAEAFRNSPEGKTEAFVSQASGLCRAELKARAKYPSKVDFNWFKGNGNRYWMNFNSDGDSRVLIQQSGKMMNGFGNMIPFNGVCKYDYNPSTNKYSVVEVLI